MARDRDADAQIDTTEAGPEATPDDAPDQADVDAAVAAHNEAVAADQGESSTK